MHRLMSSRLMLGRTQREKDECTDDAGTVATEYPLLDDIPSEHHLKNAINKLF